MKKYLCIYSLIFCTLFGCSSTVSVPAASSSATADTASDAIEQLMSSQHTVRAFTEQSISEGDLQKILNVTFDGATSGGQQSREVVVVNDRSIMKKIQAVHAWAGSLDTAPIVIVLCGNQSTAAYPENLSQDTSIAAQNLILMASSLGISSNLMSIYPLEQRIAGIQDALDLPSNVVTYLMVAIGYSSEDSSSASSANTGDHSSVIYYNTYQAQ